MRKSAIRSMGISVLIIGISVFNFSNLKGSECIRPIHIVTLLVCGLAIGVFLSAFFAWIRDKRTY